MTKTLRCPSGSLLYAVLVLKHIYGQTNRPELGVLARPVSTDVGAASYVLVQYFHEVFKERCMSSRTLLLSAQKGGQGDVDARMQWLICSYTALSSREQRSALHDVDKLSCFFVMHPRTG